MNIKNFINGFPTNPLRWVICKLSGSFDLDYEFSGHDFVVLDEDEEDGFKVTLKCRNCGVISFSGVDNNHD